MNSNRAVSRRARAIGAAACVCALIVGGCDSATPEPTPEQPAPALGAPTDTYVVRGEVAALPSQMSDIRVRHEHIPDFVNFEGVNPVGPDGVRGMKAMTMPFPVRNESEISGLGVGDKIEFTLNVDRQTRTYWLSSVRKLPAETELDFGVKPDASAGEGP